MIWLGGVALCFLRTGISIESSYLYPDCATNVLAVRLMGRFRTGSSKSELKLASESLFICIFNVSDWRPPEVRRASRCSPVGGEMTQTRPCSVQRSHLIPDVGMHLRLRLRHVSHWSVTDIRFLSGRTLDGAY